MEWLEHIVYWHWWILAGMLLILELTSPVFFLLWLGFFAAAIGFLVLTLLIKGATGILLGEVKYGETAQDADLGYGNAQPQN